MERILNQLLLIVDHNFIIERKCKRSSTIIRMILMFILDIHHIVLEKKGKIKNFNSVIKKITQKN